MDYDNIDEHDEDDLPEISLSMLNYTRKISNDNNHFDDRSPENWQNLYETSNHSLQSDEDDQKLFYTVEQPPNERPDSPSIDSNINKSKWEIRLPELLNTTVGPDRQKRDISRRHTTNIVFQQSQDSTDSNKPIIPLVKQLRQKFDQMTTNNRTIDDTKNSPKFHRVASLTCRGLTANTGERVIQRSRPVLPLRPTPEITPVKSRSGSIGSVNSRITVTSNRNHRDKTGPPISYSKHYYPPPSTTSVVKQLIGGGATLVYDSITQKSSSTIKPLIKNARSIELTREDLQNTNSPLTGRQLPSDNGKNQANFKEMKKNNHHHQLLKSNEDESDENYYEPMLDRPTYNLSRRNTTELPTEPWNRRRSTSTSRIENNYPVFDMEK